MQYTVMSFNEEEFQHDVSINLFQEAQVKTQQADLIIYMKDLSFAIHSRCSKITMQLQQEYLMSI